MNFKDKVVDFLDKKLPVAKYSTGENAKCVVYRIGCFLDPMD